MTGKILTIVFAVLAGAGAVVGYHLVAENMAPPREEKLEQRIQVLEGQLTALQKELQAQGEVQQTAGNDVEALAARFETVDKQLSEVREKQAQLSEAKPAQQVSGHELVRALKEMPAEGREIVRRAMRPREQRAEKESKTEKVARESLELEVNEAIARLADQLDLTPMQLEEMKEIKEDYINTVLDAAREAEGQDDPTYLRKVRKRMEKNVTVQVAQLLTPEQLDRWRDLNDDIERLYPRDR